MESPFTNESTQQNRDNWEDGNPASWGRSPQYQPGSPLHAFEAPAPRGKYSEAGTTRDSSSAYANAPSPYLPSTPGGQLLTDVTSSPVIGTDSEGPCFMPDIMVNVHRFGEDSVGVIREVLPDGSCRADLGMNGNGKSEMITTLPTEIEKVPPRKNDKIKIVGGSQRGASGKLIGVDGTDGIVKLDDTLDVMMLDMVMLVTLA